MKYVYALMLSALLAFSASAELVLVENGAPRASIVIAADLPRLVDLAARELQEYILKMSGAELPIGTAPDPTLPVTVYVGRSAFTDDLGISDDGLAHGAYRIVSGAGFLVLLGNDYDYAPMEPYARRAEDFPLAQEAWAELSGTFGLNPLNYYMGPHRGYHREAGIWLHDEAGSLNAVYGFLSALGVRWYMPGDLGEVVPESATIAVGSLDETVVADFPLRNMARIYNHSSVHMEDLMWWRRQGLNAGLSTVGSGMYSHGMRMVLGDERVKQAHPEFYAMYSGERDTAFRGTGRGCYASEGLFEATVAYAQAVFDHYGPQQMRAIDIMPQDGYMMCQCDQCADLSASEAIWAFTDRVARALYATHPEHLVTAGAYATYRNPPENISAFSPNLVVYISHPRPVLNDPQVWADYQALIEGWKALLAPGRLIRNSNNTSGVIHPRAMAKDLAGLKGAALGDHSSFSNERIGQVTRRPGKPGINHLTLYVNGRYLWDADQDIDALLDEYYTLFYGPAADAMRQAFDFAEDNRVRPMAERRDFAHHYRTKSNLVAFIEKLQLARQAAGDTIYGQRVDVVLSGLPDIEAQRATLHEMETHGDPRMHAALAVGTGMDGTPEAYSMVNLHTGEAADLKTTFTLKWDGDGIIFDIYCEEPDMDSLFVTSDVWGGDSVAILIETPYHSYYHVEINPAGAVFDRSMGAEGTGTNWGSLTLVKTERGENFWRVEARIAVGLPAEGAESDPMHRVVGDKPTHEEPWFFLVGRSRPRGDQRAAYSFVPTGGSFHQPAKFGRLVIEP